MVYSPSAAISVTSPSSAGGTIILCNTAEVSCTSPSTSPAFKTSPTLATGLNSHFFSLLMESTSIPLAMKSPEASLMILKGLWIPSKMELITPGPSSTDNAPPVHSTTSPGWIPAVSSYTWIVAVSPSSSMISPISFSLPTLTISSI